MEYKNFDNLLAKLGFGRWTLLMYLSYYLWSLLLPYFSLGGAFYNPVVEHWCQIPQLDNSTWSLEQRLNYSIPWEERGGRLVRSSCRQYVRDYEAVADLPWTQDLQTSMEEASNLKTRSCDHWEYDTSTFSSTVTMEWDLVCGRAGLSPFFQSFYFFGAAFGEPMMGFLADRCGRRWVVIGSALAFGATAVGSALVPLYILVLVGRFILGMIHPIIGPAYIQGMEACPPTKVRTIMGLVSTTPFALTGMVFGTLAYFQRDWRTLQLMGSVPVIFLFIQMPWLMLQGRLEEAAKTLRKAARWHGVTLPPQRELVNLLEKFRLECLQEAEVSKSAKEEENRSVWGRLAEWWKHVTVLVRTPMLRRITLGLFGCWFCTGLTYWGMSLSGNTFSSNPFLYVVLSSLVEIPGYSGFTPVVARFGRRSVLSFNFAICAAAILTILVTPSSYTWMIFSLALVGKLFITGNYGLLYLASSELFPTSVRSRGLNISSMMARLGSIVSPFIIEVLATSYWWSPSVTFGVIAAMGSFFALLLPESKNKPMADTVEQLEILYGSSRSSSSSSIEGKGVNIPLRIEASDCEDGAGV